MFCRHNFSPKVAVMEAIAAEHLSATVESTVFWILLRLFDYLDLARFERASDCEKLFQLHLISVPEEGGFLAYTLWGSLGWWGIVFHVQASSDLLLRS